MDVAWQHLSPHLDGMGDAPISLPTLPRTQGCCWIPATYNSQPRFILRASGSCHFPGCVPRGWDRDTPGRAGCVQQPRGLVAAPGSSVPTQPPTATNTFFSCTPLAAHTLTHPRHRAHLCCLPALWGHPRSGDRPRPRTHGPQAAPTHVVPPSPSRPQPPQHGAEQRAAANLR